ncbi:MAG: peptidylprolyl isomerase [Armatimonadota bacterium]|nr:peptidylprolyl isomerase [Armatimonadota bacterium]
MRSHTLAVLLAGVVAAAAGLMAVWPRLSATPRTRPTPEVVASTRFWSLTMPELERRARVALAVTGVLPGREAGRQLEAMKRRQVYVLAKLLLVADRASREGVVVPEERVSERVAQLRRARGDKAWASALSAWGVTEEDVRRELRRELTWLAYLQRLEAAAEIPEESVRRFYEDNRARMRTPDLVRLRGVLVKDARTAEQVRRLALAGHDLAALARRYSVDTTASQGGDTGWIPRDRLHPWLAVAVSRLKPGQLSGVVRGPQGYYVVRVEHVKPGRPLSYREVRNRIHADLRRAAAQTELERVLYHLYRASGLRYYYPVFFDAGEHARKTLEGGWKKDS